MKKLFAFVMVILLYLTVKSYDYQILKSEVYVLNLTDKRELKFQFDSTLKANDFYIDKREVKTKKENKTILQLTPNNSNKELKVLKVNYAIDDDETLWFHGDELADSNPKLKIEWNDKKYGEITSVIKHKERLYGLYTNDNKCGVRFEKNDGSLFEYEIKIEKNKNVNYCIGVSNDYFICHVNGSIYFFNIESNLLEKKHEDVVSSIQTIDVDYKPLLLANNEYIIFQDLNRVLVFHNSELVINSFLGEKFIIKKLFFIDNCVIVLGHIVDLIK